MGIRFYDEAIVNKIQKWIKDPKMVVLKPNEVSRLFQIKADQNNDKPLTLPLVSIARDPNVVLKTPVKTKLSSDGYKSIYTKDGVLLLNAIPIDISYQLDIYTKKYEEGDEYIRNFIFNFINHPKMVITIPYNNSNLEHVCNIRLDGSVTDNSDISEHLFSDQFTRWTLKINIDDAFLFSAPIKDYLQIDTENSKVQIEYEE